MNEAQTRRLAAMLTEKQRRDILTNGGPVNPLKNERF